MGCGAIMNEVIGWVKEHPALAASVGGGIALVLYFATRSSATGTTSDAAAVANSQLQQASLANQNAAVQAQAQTQQNEAALAAQVANNQSESQLAAIVAQTGATEKTAELAANVQNTTTAAQESVATSTINAELAAQQTQVAAESQGLKTEFDYLTQANANQTALSTTELNDVTEGGKNGGIFYGQSATTNEALLSALSLVQPGGIATVPSAEGSLAGTAAANYAENASIWNTVTGSISKAFSGLFS
jgi:hypothetical protein